MISCIVPFGNIEAANVLRQRHEVSGVGCFSGDWHDSKTLHDAIVATEDRFILIYFGQGVPVLKMDAIHRMAQIMSSVGAAMIYPDSERKKFNDCQLGSVRDDFDFGNIVLLDRDKALSVMSSALNLKLKYAGWYKLRLGLSRAGGIFHLLEPLYSESGGMHDESSFNMFQYVDPANRDLQIEMETVFTDHLRKIGAWLPPGSRNVDFGGTFPTEASVIIPVRDRVDTIGDAIASALSQRTDFPYNVIVVDNHSSDGTSDVIDRLRHPNLIHIKPDSENLGIGGCWNLAVGSEHCGRFAVQLDSDDIYSSENVLSDIVSKFYEDKCAMVVGSYTLTDLYLHVIPPGLVAHEEWTADNGHNNLLRVNGIGAPRAFMTSVAREIKFPDVSYGEDYAMALAVSREYRIGRILHELYFCRRWGGNSDASISDETLDKYNRNKDTLRTFEILSRIKLNHDRHRVTL